MPFCPRFFHLFFFPLFTSRSSLDESTVFRVYVRGFHVRVRVQASRPTHTHVRGRRTDGVVCEIRGNTRVPRLALVYAFIPLFRRHVRHVHKISLSAVCARYPYPGERHSPAYSRNSAYTRARCNDKIGR